MPIIGIGAGNANNTGSILTASGSVGKNFASMSFENTASLGLSGSMITYSASLASVINNTTASYDFTRHSENTIKFLTAKVYENTDKITKAYTDNQIYYGFNRFQRPIRSPQFQGPLLGDVTGDVTGNATTATTATNATNVNVAAMNTNAATHYITFVDGVSGNQKIETDTGLSYKPSSNLISGKITSASLALSHKGTNSEYWLTPTDFQMMRSTAVFDSVGAFMNISVGRTAVATFTMPRPVNMSKNTFRITCAQNTATCALTMHSLYGPFANPVTLASGNVNTNLQISTAAKNFNPATMYLAASVVSSDDKATRLHSGFVGFMQ